MTTVPQRYRQTDGKTDGRLEIAILRFVLYVHRAVKNETSTSLVLQSNRSCNNGFIVENSSR